MFSILKKFIRIQYNQLMNYIIFSTKFFSIIQIMSINYHSVYFNN